MNEFNELLKEYGLNPEDLKLDEIPVLSENLFSSDIRELIRYLDRINNFNNIFKGIVIAGFFELRSQVKSTQSQIAELQKRYEKESKEFKDKVGEILKIMKKIDHEIEMIKHPHPLVPSSERYKGIIDILQKAGIKDN